MTLLDGIVLVWIAVWALLGAGRGMLEQILSLSGLAVGAIVGSRVAPLLLPDGRESQWLGLVALGGAILGAVLVQALLLALARPLRRAVARGPARAVDRGGGLFVGAALGLTLAWLLAAVVVLQPSDRAVEFRTQVRESHILSTALRVAPPDEVLGSLARSDVFPLIPLPAAALPEPDPSVARSPGARRARESVVELRGSGCGLIKQGSGLGRRRRPGGHQRARHRRRGRHPGDDQRAGLTGRRARLRGPHQRHRADARGGPRPAGPLPRPEPRHGRRR